MSILVVNAGSSSVKFGLFDFDTLRPTWRGKLDRLGHARYATITLQPDQGPPIHAQVDAGDYRSGVVAAMDLLLKNATGVVPAARAAGACDAAVVDGAVGAVGAARAIRAVGHRLIHGGEEIRVPVRIDAAMKQTIAKYAHLAPLHIPPGLEAIAATESALPGVFQAGVFDTAFFANIPDYIYLYPVPYEWYSDWGIRRFGFHGTSHAYCAKRTAEMLERDPVGLRIVICHLGQGGSATAVRDGVAVTNSMGFTPLEGLMMGTRCGTVDPGILLYVMREKGLSLQQVDEALHDKSGLLGLSGVSSDFRRVESAAAEGHARSRLALDVYAHRVRTMVGALAVTLGGVDVLVFTGGIGENSSRLRADVCRGLECLGVQLDGDRNARCCPDADVAADGSPARVLVIHTREDFMIARQTRQLCLDASSAGR